MSAMVPIALSIVLSTLVGSYVGFRTLAIARRTRKLPELAVGTGLVAYAAVSQVALITLLVLGETAPPSVRTGLLVTRVAALHTSLLALSVFTWHTFGKSSRWRQSLAAIAVSSRRSVAVSLPRASSASMVARGLRTRGPPHWTPASLSRSAGWEPNLSATARECAAVARWGSRIHS